jgi:transposase-like protein
MSSNLALSPSEFLIATPLRIYINQTGLYEMAVLCPVCSSENVHVLNHAMKLGYRTSVIEFGDLGFWHCHSPSCRAKYRFFKENPKVEVEEEQEVETRV